MSFTNAATGVYYYDAVQWAAKNSVTAGITATSFSLNNTCTRTQIVTFPYCHMGTR